ncbi:MAG: RNA-binding S4 domain-containing protein [Alphaproteobacteria bacterium]
MSAKSRGDLGRDEPIDGAKDGLRLDKWLWQARFFKTRSLAADVASKGKVRINRMLVTKPHYRVRPGDVLTFAQGREIRVVRVVALGERRGPAPEARTLYEDIGEPSCEGSVDSKPVPAVEPPAQKREAWGVRGGIDPRRARRQAIDAKMNGR